MSIIGVVPRIPVSNKKISRSLKRAWKENYEKMVKASSHFRQNYPKKEDYCVNCGERKKANQSKRGWCVYCTENKGKHV